MGFVPTKQEVYEFLQSPSRPHGVLGYLDQQGNPETAFVGFSATLELEILFGTSDISRKFNSLLEGAVVAFNVTDKDLRQTVQLQGKVREIIREELPKYEEAHYAKLGESSRRYKDLPDQHFYLITPTSLRFSDVMDWPWTVTQVI